MTCRRALIAVVWAALLPATMVQAEDVVAPDTRVRIEFLRPERFTDVGNRPFLSEKVRDAYLVDLHRHIERRALRLLADGHTLRILVTDIDMAGAFGASRRGLSDVRVIRDSHPPRIDLQFRIDAGAMVKQGERRLRNLDFQTGGLMYRGDSLRYEKALLDDWLDRELGPAGS